MAERKKLLYANMGELPEGCGEPCFELLNAPNGEKRHRVALNRVGGMSQFDAYRAAGYPGRKSAADQMFRNDKVEACVTYHSKKASESATMELGEAIELLENFARANIRDLARVSKDDKEKAFVDFNAEAWDDDQDPELTRRVIEIGETAAGGVRLKMVSPLDALRELGKMRSWYAAKKVVPLTAEEARRDLADMMGITVEELEKERAKK